MGFGEDNILRRSIASSSDVALNMPLDSQVLTYNASLQKWQNTSLASNSGYDSAVAQGFNGTEEEWVASINDTRPANYSRFRPYYHLTPRLHWMNDPQRPLYLNGLWHFYFLYNKDYPGGNGTEWCHVTSTDLVNWKHEGIAIQKYQNGLGDIETGSAVVDVNNTAGFGAGAVIALMTQMSNGVQVTSLFYSTDGGYSFTNYTGNPVMPNPGQPDFRDPKVFWHTPSNRWILTLSEHDKTGFYTSSNLKNWTYVDAFTRSDIGIHECSDLFEIELDGNPNNKKWVFMTGANGFNYGMTTGCAYWVGSFNGTTFTPDTNNFQWMDTGPDFYAAVTCEDPFATRPTQHRLTIGWMNNWSYANETPMDEFQGNAQTFMRTLSLKTVDGAPTLVQEPLQRVNQLRGVPVVIGAQQIPETGMILPSFPGGAYCLDFIIEKSPQSTGSALTIRIKGSNDGTYGTNISYNFTSQVVSIDRSDCSAVIANQSMSSGARNTYEAVRTAQAPPRASRVRITAYVDYGSVELFINDGERMMTAALFPDPAAEKITVTPTGGTILLHQFAYYQMRPSFSILT
ncbi:MAG: glycoside hydrolase family 32 protein [Candidatus Microsaccharimonas sp.]